MTDKRRTSIQNLIAISFSVLIVIIIITVAFIFFSVTSESIEENTNEYVYQLVTQINYDIEYYHENIENTIITLKADDEVNQYFTDKDTSSSFNLNLSHKLNNYMLSRNDISNIFLVRNNGDILNNYGNYQIKDNAYGNISSYLNNSNSISISGSHIQNIIIGEYKWVVTFSIPVISTDGNTEGFILVDLNFNLIEDMLDNLSLGEKGYMFIVDNQGNIIYHPKYELINSGITSENISLILDSKDGQVSDNDEDRNKNYIVSTTEYSDWKVVGTIYDDEVNKYDELLRKIFFIVIGLAVAIATLLSIFISRSFLHPLKTLVDGMHVFKHGDLDTQIMIQSNNEIGELAEEFNDMTHRIKNLIETNVEAEASKRRLELKALQSQINPHFLFNTLDSIIWMAEAGNNAEVVTMTSSLAKLFRISINKGFEFIPLKKEIEHVESYLQIQKIRYGSKFDYSIKVDQSLYNYAVIKLIIQPIVENAIYHGIKQMAGQGFIEINVTETADTIIISVSDNGIGMNEETLKKISSDFKFKTKDTGIGISNVNKRITLYYGENYGLQVESEIAEGTTVKITIPKITMEECESYEK